MNLGRYYPIKPSEIDPSRLFFTVVKAAKAKEILDENELKYVDSVINGMISDALKVSGKRSVRTSVAKELVEGVFRVLDRGFSPDDPFEIIDAVKNRVLEKYSVSAMRKCASELNGIRFRIYHMEHLKSKYPAHRLDFVITIKERFAYTDIYRAGGESTAFVQSLLGLAAPVSLDSLSDKIDILCALCEMLCRIPADAVTSCAFRLGLANELSDTEYDLNFISSVVLTSLYCGFYRIEKMPMPLRLKDSISDEITSLSEDELCSDYLDYIKIFLHHNGIDDTEWEKAQTEQARIYACVISDGGISKQTLARYLAMYAKETLQSSGNITKVLFFE